MIQTLPWFIGLAALFVTVQFTSFILHIHSNKFYSYFHFIGAIVSYGFFFNLIHKPITSVLLVILIGTLWEIYEWLLWKFVLKKDLYRPRWSDTKNDLFIDTLGGFIGFLLLVAFRV